MSKLIRSTITVLVPFAVAACGGGVGGTGAPISSDTAAAQAAYRMQQTGESLRDRQSQGLTVAQVGGVPGIGPDGVGTETTYTLRGAEGEAEITVVAEVTGSHVETRWSVEYRGYSTNGIDFIDGNVDHRSRVETGSTVAVTTEVEGEVDIWGSQAAHLEVDVSVSVLVSSGVNGASVQLDGYVTADGDRFDYTGASYDLVDGVF